MPKGIPLTEQELDRRRHQIFNASVHVFLEKGFQETTMQEIAEAAGMGKSTLYDYFKTKDEILFSVVEDEIYDLTELAKKIAAQELPAAEKLKQVMRAHLEHLREQKDFYSKLMFEVQRLGSEDQQRLQAKRHAYQDLLCSLIEQAIREGTFRPVTPLLATRILLSLLSPAVFTSRPTGTPEQMMDEAIQIFYRGVMAG
jgi:TetR/AcrR family transcriptional regulator, cholesterol catabolism regulator